jgi:hypothetical protein
MVSPDVVDSMRFVTGPMQRHYSLGLEIGVPYVNLDQDEAT